ncbi:MAG TPA: type IX secretion system plug protein domain-containing protein, partial [Candidatus Kapabacteria bacterium]|nr:type IX secretion system plug protein domain-containing protein [Candidatus Kapabacteria bacterium]
YGDKTISVDFDIDSPIDPNLQLVFMPCRRDWTEEQDLFSDNFMNLIATNVHGMRADPRVNQYSFHYSDQFPDKSRHVVFEYSGNYKVMIVDGSDTIAEGRFYVVDQLSAIAMNVYNEIDRTYTPPQQIHNVEVVGTFAPEVFQTSIEEVDIIQQSRLLAPYRVFPGDTSGNSRIGFTGGYISFTALNVLPGNAYRLLDITDPGLFPPTTSPIAMVPKDIIRTGLSATADYNGSEILKGTSPPYADYIPIRFRLDANGKRDADIFVVGAFNGWIPDENSKMEYNVREDAYECTLWLKRGGYDYQYVMGKIDPQTHVVVDQNWIALEGNSWSAPVAYTSLVYYSDPRYGGIDRIVGSGRH